MKFEEKHKQFFDCEDGAFSLVTSRENEDGQITLDLDEKRIFVNYFGSGNILHGNRAANPEMASKEFLIFPTLKTGHLNLVYPKHNKPELRLYLVENVFKPLGGDIWFVFINSAERLVLGSMSEKDWDSIKGRDKAASITASKEDNFDTPDKIRYDKTEHSFEPGAMSIIQMGQELIGHPNTAVSELVKNGYDADATISKVYFHYSKNLAESFAVFYDNGSGMGFETLFGGWLQPSVSLKRDGDSLSPDYKRHFLGSKGIGRLAAMALGQYVTVVTKQKKETEYNWITVNRELFRAKVLLSQIKFPGNRVPKAVNVFANESILQQRKISKNDIIIRFLSENSLLNFTKGTLIVIEKLDDSVLKILSHDFLDAKGLPADFFSYKSTEFYKALATLITPITLNKNIQTELVHKGIITTSQSISAIGDPGFNIEFGTNLLVEEDEQLVDWAGVAPIPIHTVYDYRVYGKVNSTGDVIGLFEYNRLDSDLREEKFEISAADLRDGSKIASLVGEYYFDIRIYDIGETDNIEKLANKAGFDNKSQFRAAFKDFQGLRVSKNGFGVKPYGEEVEDWIGLSKERVQDPGHNVNTNQILGYVYFFSPQNDALEEQTNREGFRNNAAFIHVKQDLKVIFKNLGRRRYNYRAQHNLGRIPQSKHNRPDFQAYLAFLKVTDNVSQIRKYSEGFMQAVNTSMDNLEESLTFSERLASLGSGIELVYHEMAQPISRLKTTESSLELKKDKVSNEVRDSFLINLNTLVTSTGVLASLRESLEPAIGKSKAKRFKPYSTFLKVCFLFKSDIEENGITIKIDSSLNSYELHDVEYAFWIAFLNILNNAIYWIKKSGKKAEVSFNIINSNIVISNTGPLIDSSVINTLFEYGVTTKNEKSATGLGLAFTRSILSKIDWDIEATNSNKGPVFTIKKSKNE